MNEHRPTFLEILFKTVVVHTLTYFLMGVIAATVFNYKGLYALPALSNFMRSIDDRWVMAGPLFQPLRGLLFALVFYLLREPFFQKKNGWLVLWLTLLVFGIFSTFGPTPGSLEGLVYTQLSISEHLRGLPEIIVQALLFAWLLYYWINHAEKKWLSRLLGVLFVLVLIFPAMGLIFTR